MYLNRFQSDSPASVEGDEVHQGQIPRAKADWRKQAGPSIGPSLSLEPKMTSEIGVYVAPGPSATRKRRN